MTDMFTSQYGSQVYSLRNSTFNFEIPNARTEPYRNSFAFTGAKIWNELPEDFKTAPSLNAFKRKIKSYNISYHIISYHIISYHTILYYTMLCYVMLCYVMLCYVMLCYVMLCYVMLCYVILYYIVH